MLSNDQRAKEHFRYFFPLRVSFIALPCCRTYPGLRRHGNFTIIAHLGLKFAHSSQAAKVMEWCGMAKYLRMAYFRIFRYHWNSLNIRNTPSILPLLLFQALCPALNPSTLNRTLASSNFRPTISWKTHHKLGLSRATVPDSTLNDAAPNGCNSQMWFFRSCGRLWQHSDGFCDVDVMWQESQSVAKGSQTRQISRHRR